MCGSKGSIQGCCQAVARGQAIFHLTVGCFVGRPLDRRTRRTDTGHSNSANDRRRYINRGPRLECGHLSQKTMSRAERVSAGYGHGRCLHLIFRSQIHVIDGLPECKTGAGGKSIGSFIIHDGAENQIAGGRRGGRCGRSEVCQGVAIGIAQGKDVQRAHRSDPGIFMNQQASVSRSNAECRRHGICSGADVRGIANRQELILDVVVLSGGDTVRIPLGIGTGHRRVVLRRDRSHNEITGRIGAGERLRNARRARIAGSSGTLHEDNRHITDIHWNSGAGCAVAGRIASDCSQSMRAIRHRSGVPGDGIRRCR